MAGKRRGRPPSVCAPVEPAPFEWLSRSAFARWFGVRPQTVTGWIGDGKLPPSVMRADGMIHAERGLAALVEAGALADGPPRSAIADVAAAAAMVSYDEARAFSEVLRVHRAHLDLRERQGELVRRDVAEGVLFEAGRSLRDHWLNWPPRVAAEMGAALGVAPAVMLATLEKFTHEHLEQMAAPVVEWRVKAEEEAEG